MQDPPLTLDTENMQRLSTPFQGSGGSNVIGFYQLARSQIHKKPKRQVIMKAW